MPIRLNWYGNSHRMILIRFIGAWQVADFITALDNSANMIHSAQHPVHLIYDFSNSGATPRDLLAGLHHANRIAPANQGVMVYVNANAVIKAFVLMAKRAGLPMSRHIYHADSHADAYRMIIDKAHLVQSV
ncbi:MAG: hypothetical protein ACFE0Q_12125 [Anaerolineae bacterium]